MAASEELDYSTIIYDNLLQSVNFPSVIILGSNRTTLTSSSYTTSLPRLVTYVEQTLYSDMNFSNSSFELVTQEQQQQQQQQQTVYSLPYFRELVLISYLITFVIGLIGNSLVIFVICYFTEVRRKSVANYYILNLAIADWCFVLFLPLYGVSTFTSSWPFGTVLCKLATMVRETNRYTSIFTLVVLSADRYIASYPDLRHWRKPRVGHAVCCAIWLICLLITSPYLIYSTVTSSPKVSCKVSTFGDVNYMFTSHQLFNL